MKIFEFRLRFHWRLFLGVQSTTFQHWFRSWLGAVQATSHYLNQWWLVYWHIYASLGLNELVQINAWQVPLHNLWIKQWSFKHYLEEMSVVIGVVRNARIRSYVNWLVYVQNIRHEIKPFTPVQYRLICGYVTTVCVCQCAIIKVLFNLPHFLFH